jgi:hypothetical protein
MKVYRYNGKKWTYAENRYTYKLYRVRIEPGNWKVYHIDDSPLRTGNKVRPSCFGMSGTWEDNFPNVQGVITYLEEMTGGIQ